MEFWLIRNYLALTVLSASCMSYFSKMATCRYIHCMYCDHERKRASGAPRTHFRARKISKFPGDPWHPLHNQYGLPWALPIFTAALPVHAAFKMYVCYWSLMSSNIDSHYSNELPNARLKPLGFLLLLLYWSHSVVLRNFACMAS